MKKIFISLFIILISGNIFGLNSDNTEWWLYNYGDYSKTDGKKDPRVKWAYNVFQRVQTVSDRGWNCVPRLYIVNDPTEIYAIALPDGGIIINPKTLDICYGECDRKKGDTSMAFIFGHELAHQANRDYLDKDIYNVLSKYGSQTDKKTLTPYLTPRDKDETREKKKHELLADKIGALYACMAGYDIWKILREEENFLRHWAQQTGISMDDNNHPGHPSFDARLKNLRVQLKSVAEQLELFHAAVLLYHNESFHDAASAFKAFSQYYPSREVFNNIGACYLGLGLRTLRRECSDEYYRFRYSTTIDYTATAFMIGKNRGNQEYINFIKKAVRNFNLAIERDANDPCARINLAAALILLKEYAAAQAQCDTVLKKHPHNFQALNHKAIAFYYYGKEMDLDTTQIAIGVLEKAHRYSPRNFEILYNLASLKHLRQRLAGAKIYWQKYLKLPVTPRDEFYKRIHEKMKIASLPNYPIWKTKAPDIPGEIHLGQNFSQIERTLGKQNIHSFKFPSSMSNNNDIHHKEDNLFLNMQILEKNGIRVIALDETVELVEWNPPEKESIAKVLKPYGPPGRVVRHTCGNYYIYDNLGFSVKEIDGIVHAYTWFERGF